MKNILGYIFTLFTLLVVFSSYRNASIPDPEDFAKKFMETIKKNDKQLYLDVFSVKREDFKWLVDQKNNDPYSSAEQKERLSLFLLDTNLTEGMNHKLDRGYNRLAEWITTDSIDISKLEYIRYYYELNYRRSSSSYVLDDTELYVRYKDKYYCLAIEGMAYVNGRWVSGIIKHIEPANQFLEVYDEYYDYPQGITLDSSVAVTEAPPVEAYDNYPAELSIENMTGKQRKLAKKIGTHYQKITKLQNQMKE